MLEDLEPLLGEWRIETSLPFDADGPALSVFEWMLDGHYLLQRTSIPQPFPDSTSIVSCDPETGAYTQHYFDARGVVRLYAMTFRDGVWTLTRETPDFSALSFSQRFTGEFSDDGSRIDGRWERTNDAGAWELDFEFAYLRAV